MSKQNGVLPSGWAEVRLEELGMMPTVTVDPSKKPDKKWELWSVPAFPTGRPEVLTGAEIGSTKQKVYEGDVLLCKINPRINRVWVVTKAVDLEQIASGEWIIFQKTEIDPHFLMYRLRESKFREELCAEVSGVGGSLTRARPQTVKTLKLSLPPLAEQRRIVAKIDALQERSRRAREALMEVGPLQEQFRQSVLAAAFRGDLTADWRATHPDVEPASKLLQRIRVERRRRWEQVELAKYEAKGQKPPKSWQERYVEPEPVDDSELSELPEGWCWTRFEEVLSELRNGVSPKPNDSPPGIPILRINSVRSRKVLLEEIRYLPDADNFVETYRLKDQDLLFTRYNGSLELLGVCGLVQGLGDRVILYPDKLIRVRTDRHLVLPEFIEMYFASPSARQRVTNKAKTTSGQQGVSGADIKEQPVPLAPLSEQEHAVNQLHTLMKTSDGLEAVFLDIHRGFDRLDQAILAKAFRGELVPQDPNDEPASVLLNRIQEQRAHQTETTARKMTKAQREQQDGKKSVEIGIQATSPGRSVGSQSPANGS